MRLEQHTMRGVYKRLLALYPRTFKEELGESMEQTFHDLWNEKRQTKDDLFGFVLWTFIETAIGIVKEYVVLISPGDIMQTVLKTAGSSSLLSLLIILPFMIMEVVNRRALNEEFPFMLFSVMWLNLFAISLILLPIVRGRRTGNHDMANPVPAQRNTLLTGPRSAALISVALILSPGILPLLDSIGWLSVERLFNGTNPEVAYLPGQILSFSLILFPVAAGIIAGGPIIRTLRSGGRLFAHPIHLIIVVFLVSGFVFALVGLVIDQWPCFMGVPNCD